VDWIPLDHLSEIGPWGLVTLFVILVFTGYLVTGREREYWRKAFFTEQEMRRDLEVTGRLTRSVLAAPPLPSEPPGPGKETENP
jgi:hypothetical protein